MECCYQNVGIATSVAITMFQGKELSRAVGVPLFYGLVEAVVLGIYCITTWKIGWTKAPPDESFCVVIGKSYEVKCAQIFDLNAIEVVLGSNKDRSNNGNEDIVEDDILFELDHSTVSFSDSERENGSIYAISYPAPSQKESEKNKIESKQIQRSFNASPNTKMKGDTGKISRRMVQKFENRENFAMNANTIIYNHDHYREKDLELGIKKEEHSSDTLLNANSLPTHISQNDIENSPAESSLSISIKSESNESLSNILKDSQEPIMRTPKIPELCSSDLIANTLNPRIHTFQPSSVSSYIKEQKCINFGSTHAALLDERDVDKSKESNPIQMRTSSS